MISIYKIYHLIEILDLTKLGGSRKTYWMSHQIQMWKCSSKIGSIYISLPGAFWKKETVTTWTKHIHCVVTW